MSGEWFRFLSLATDLSDHLMSWVDYAIFGILAVSTLLSLMRGFVREALSLVVWVLAFWIALAYSSKLAGLLADHISVSSIRLAVAFVVLFVATFIIGGISTYLISKLVQKRFEQRRSCGGHGVRAGARGAGGVDGGGAGGCHAAGSGAVVEDLGVRGLFPGHDFLGARLAAARCCRRFH